MADKAYHILSDAQALYEIQTLLNNTPETDSDTLQTVIEILQRAGRVILDIEERNDLVRIAHEALQLARQLPGRPKTKTAYHAFEKAVYARLGTPAAATFRATVKDQSTVEAIFSGLRALGIHETTMDLADELQLWFDAPAQKNIPKALRGSADDVLELAGTHLKTDQRDWLTRFCERWDDAVTLECAHT